ncbi:MAG: M48 family metallopeptidase [Acidiferrobacterales bacterium]
MKVLKADFYDGNTSARQEVELQFGPPGQLRVTGLERELIFPLSQLKISPRIGNTPRSIYLPNGAKCEALDNDTIDSVLERYGQSTWQRFVHKLESRLVYVVLALVITVISVWGLVQYGVPALAERVARSLPTSVDETLSREGLSVLDQSFFSPSELDAEKQRDLRTLLAGITQRIKDTHTYRLEFRNGVGANAFALPSGLIVVTDELVGLAENDNEILAVLAHEVGHVVHRHQLRRLLQDSVTVLIIASIAGDVTSLASLSATLPTLIIETKYSRDFEREADQFALRYLRDNNIRLHHFADILLRMEKERPSSGLGGGYLASHPATKERAKLFQDDD